MRFLLRLPLVLSLVIPGLPSLTHSQDVDWSSTRFSVTAQWIMPQKNFGVYWKDGPAVGLLAEIPMEGGFSPVAMAVASWHVPAETARKFSIPRVFLFQLGGGVRWSMGISETVCFSLSGMLVNNAFILTGPPVRPGLDNAIESEFGFSASAALAFESESLPPLSFLVSYQPILVGLEPIAIFSLGFAIQMSNL